MASKFTKSELEQLYSQYGSIAGVARALNIPDSTLGSYFINAGIKTMSDPISKERLVAAFSETGSWRKVAGMLDVSYGTILSYAKKYGIYFKKKFPYTKEELIKLHEECGSITKVSAKLGKAYTTVLHWFTSYGITVNKSGMTIFQEIRNTPMTDVQKSALIGSMLGDGGLWLAPHNKNARLYVNHCEKQLKYLEWLHGIFTPFARPVTLTNKACVKTFGDREINASNFYRFYTIAHPDITEVFKSNYKNGLKCASEDLIDKVDWLAMSIWIGDDGSIQRDRQGVPSSCDICTNSFSYEDHLILLRVVQNFFNGNLKIVEHGGTYKGEKRTDLMIRMQGSQCVNDFLNKIKTI